jgi:hypothetical protein
MGERVLPGCNQSCQTNCGSGNTCIETGKIYDSCRDKECIENLRVYLTEAGQCLVDRAISVKYANLGNGTYIFSDTGTVAYVLPKTDVFFSLDKCMYMPKVFQFVGSRTLKAIPENQLTPTLDILVGKGGKLLTRLKAADWDTFVDMDLLEAFDYPNLYQAEPLGIIIVTEGEANTPVETLCGYVLPVRTGKEQDGHYNDKKGAPGK